VSANVIALGMMSGIVAVGAIAGFYASHRHKMDLEQWTVGGRGFGLVLVWLLMAGEVYTTFTFLGASGWAYSRGGPALYILGYQPLWAVVSFYLLPQIWEVGRKYRLQTQADFFQLRYGSKYLTAFVALVGVVFLIPYLQLQLTGLGIIVEVASFQSIGRAPAMVIAFSIVAAFVFVSGVRGVAWVSVIKDVLLLCRHLCRYCRTLYLFRRHRTDVRCTRTRQASASADARRHQEPGPRLVLLNGSPDFFGFLHVAASVCRQLYR